VLIYGELLHAIMYRGAAAAAAFNKTYCHKNSNPERNIAASMK
jgi:hypothetical protein